MTTTTQARIFTVRVSYDVCIQAADKKDAAAILEELFDAFSDTPTPAGIVLWDNIELETEITEEIEN